LAHRRFATFLAVCIGGGALLSSARYAAAQESTEGRAREGPSGATPVPAEAQSKEVTIPGRETLPSPIVRATALEESNNPLRQSVLIFDQSTTTQTLDVGSKPLSYVALYELWLSLRPRYSFDEHWSLRARLDYTKELTNAQTTTYRNEDVFGDIWTDLVYQTKLDQLWRDTKAALGVRAIWPTSKISQANSTYVSLGARGGIEHKFQINGENAELFNNFHVGMSFVYLHPFTAAQTATAFGQFALVGQDEGAHVINIDQITGQTLPEHIVWGVLDTGLQISPRVSLTADFIAINEWHYSPKTNVSVVGAGGLPIRVPPSAGDNQFVQNLWFVANVDYALFDEVEFGIGYYNLANAIAPNGQGRTAFGSDNVWWSPDARFFFDITANLDVLFDDATGHKYTTGQGRPRGRTRVANH
jgi:hypothetical protein